MYHRALKRGRSSTVAVDIAPPIPIINASIPAQYAAPIRLLPMPHMRGLPMTQDPK